MFKVIKRILHHSSSLDTETEAAYMIIIKIMTEN